MARLAAWARDLYNPTGQKHLYKIGDSIISPANAYMQTADSILPFAYNGVVINAAQSSGGGYNSPQGSPGTNNTVSPLGATYGGAVAPAYLVEITGVPVFWKELKWASNPTYCMDSRHYGLFSTETSAGWDRNAARTSRLFHDGSSTVTARWLYLGHTKTIGSFSLVGKRTSSAGTSSGQFGGSVVATTNFTKSLSDNSLAYLEVSCGTSATEDVYTWVNNSGNFSAGTADALAFVGVRFLSAETNGVCLNHIAHSSWTTGDHLYTSGYTDARLAEYFVQTGIPTHFWLQLGENVNNGARAGSSEALASSDRSGYKANLLALISRYDSAVATAASTAGVGYVPPKYLLVSNHKTTSKTSTFRAQQVLALNELAATSTRISVLDTYNLVGGENFDTTNLTADGIHPNVKGSLFIAQRQGQAMLVDIAADNGAGGRATRSGRI